MLDERVHWIHGPSIPLGGSDQLESGTAVMPAVDLQLDGVLAGVIAAGGDQLEGMARASSWVSPGASSWVVSLKTFGVRVRSPSWWWTT